MVYLDMKDVKKSFGDLDVLNGISLEVHEGEVVSIIGPSGSGKSTLLRIATLLERMDSGYHEFMGDVVADSSSGRCIYEKQAKLKTISQKFGLVFQNFNLFPHLSILDNITLAPVQLKKMTKTEAEEEAMRRSQAIASSQPPPRA